MARYHINPKTGNPGVCHAKNKCPFGDIQSDHYDSKEGARKGYEQKMSKAALEEEKLSDLSMISRGLPKRGRRARLNRMGRELGLSDESLGQIDYLEEKRLNDRRARTQEVRNTVATKRSADGFMKVEDFPDARRTLYGLQKGHSVKVKGSRAQWSVEKKSRDQLHLVEKTDEKADKYGRLPSGKYIKKSKVSIEDVTAILAKDPSQIR
jgi:hypothetical protein